MSHFTTKCDVNTCDFTKVCQFVLNRNVEEIAMEFVKIFNLDKAQKIPGMDTIPSSRKEVTKIGLEETLRNLSSNIFSDLDDIPVKLLKNYALKLNLVL